MSQIMSFEGQVCTVRMGDIQINETTNNSRSRLAFFLEDAALFGPSLLSYF